MFDDEEEIEEEEPQQVTVFFDEDDEFDEEEEEDTSVADALTASFAAKGFSDRALVDAQAKEEDEVKRKKRERLVALKQSALTAKSLIAKKERELHELEIVIHKDHYSETRERVAEERKEISLDEETAKGESERANIKEIERRVDRDDRLGQQTSLEKEIAIMKASLAETVRAAASLEQELVRS